MITAVHALIYSKDAEALRAFFRDVLEFPSVDSGGGWLIFALPPAELGIHPTDSEPGHELWLMCKDLHATVELLKRKGVEFTQPISEQRFGLTTALELPDGSRLGLYQPTHASPLPEFRDADRTGLG